MLLQVYPRQENACMSLIATNCVNPNEMVVAISGKMVDVTIKGKCLSDKNTIKHER